MRRRVRKMEQQINNNKEYYFITNKFLATTIAYLVQVKFYKFEDAETGQTFYSFRNNTEFKNMLTLIQKVKKKNVKLK